MITVEQARDSAAPDESRRIEDAALDFARENAMRAAWRQIRADESLAWVAQRLIDLEFGKVMDMDFDRFTDLTGFEIGFEHSLAA